MRKSSEENKDEVLEFPVDPNFISYSPHINPQAMLERSELYMRWRKNQPGEADRRAMEKIDVVFVL